MHAVITTKTQLHLTSRKVYTLIPQWGAEDAEIKILSGENTELKHSPFKKKKNLKQS